jgi:hypothetical protein
MKIVLIFATVFIFVSMLMGSARRRGKLNEDANRAVGALANAMRYFVYGLLVVVAAVCALLLYQAY